MRVEAEDAGLLPQVKEDNENTRNLCRQDMRHLHICNRGGYIPIPFLTDEIPKVLKGSNNPTKHEEENGK